MLLRGVSAKAIGEALGHTSVAFTMDIYSPIIKGIQEDTMDFLDGVLPKDIIENFNDNLTTKSEIIANNN
jgi:hypothetical protein